MGGAIEHNACPADKPATSGFAASRHVRWRFALPIATRICVFWQQLSIVLDSVPGMRLDAGSAMRLLAAAAVLALAGCPSSQNPDLGSPDAGTDAGSDGESCPPVPSCTTTLKFHGNASAVELRGDF
jgi:hypothetical protein